MSQRLLEVQAALKTATDELDKLIEAAERDGYTDDQVEKIEVATAEVEKLKTEEATEQRREDAKKRAIAARDSVLNPRPAGDGDGPPRPRPVTDDVQPGFARDPKCGWDDFPQFMHAVRKCGQSSGVIRDPRLVVGAATGMSANIGEDGGFAIPPEFRTAIWDEANMEDEQNLFAQTWQIPVSGREITLNRQAETSRATGSRYGGIRGYWLNEGGTMTASKPKLAQFTLRPKKLAVLAYMTQELLDDGMALQGYLERAAGSEIRFMINDALIRGTGTGKPLGILDNNAAGTIEVSAETGQGATVLLAANIDNMWMRCHPRARSSAVWYINNDVEPHLQKIERPAGAGGLPAYMPPGGLSATPYGSLKGRPVVPIEFCETAGTSGDIILANYGWYATATKGAVRSESSIHVQFLTDEVTFRFIVEVDGQPVLDSAITPYKGSNTVSPFVKLETRS